MDKIIKPIFEFILWDNCGNNCKFCWQKKHYCPLSDEQKSVSVERVFDFIESDRFIRGSHMLLVGGELFDTPKLDSSAHLLTLMDRIVGMMMVGDVDLFYVNTNLLYEDLTLLEKLLQKIEVCGLSDRLRFTTSYDIFGRFGPDEMGRGNSLWARNMATIRREYPSINVVINTILTRQYCKLVIGCPELELVGAFRKRYGSYVNLLPYVAVDGDFTPERNDVFRTLRITEDRNSGYLDGYIRNFDLPQEKLIYRYVDGGLIFSSSELAKCGHGINFSSYSGGNTCFICDIKELFNVGQ